MSKSRSKNYFVLGSFFYNGFRICFQGKVRAVSRSQAHYYCCEEIRNDLDLPIFIETDNFSSEPISSDKWSTYGRLGYKLKYEINIMDNYRITKLNDIKELIRAADDEDKLDEIFEPAF